MAGSGPGEKQLCWVFFGDKGREKAFPDYDPRALSRRGKVGVPLGYGDLPVSRDYLERLSSTGARLRAVSRWLNAASVEADASQIAAISAMGAVERMDLVAVYRRPSMNDLVSRAVPKEIPPLEYGYAEEQTRLMRADELHARGYTGSGVRLCILDTGFDREHEALRRVRVMAERDFQRPDDFVTSFEPGQDESRLQTRHGTAMLSLAGAYKPGSLVGIAHNCDFILAKTEMYAGDDFYQEEDWWVAALEWADSLGADVASSSLGYRQWSNFASYTYADMDGSTTKSAQAADSAYRRGMVILNAAGNVNVSPNLSERTRRPDTCLATPADARGVIAVGGVWAATRQWADPVDASGNMVSGAATGPAADSLRVKRLGGADSAWMRRIKPDVSSAWQASFADNLDTASYSNVISGIGTSCATALTAGLCALLIQAHPSWGPDQVIEALKHSGGNRACVEAYLTVPESLGTDLGTYPLQNPAFSGIATGNKYYIYNGITYDLYDVYRVGWGVPDGMAALNFAAPEAAPPDRDELLDPYPNPVKAADGGAYLPYFLTRDSYRVSIHIYTLDGRRVRELDLGQQLAGEYPGLIDRVRDRTGTRPPAFWDLKNDRGQPVPGGLYLALLNTGWGQSTRKIMVLR